ncbi:hypothetical protein TKK_0015284 [Trichogramma kaykai]
MTGATLVDLQKAFDSVWLEGLIYKLSSYKMNAHLLKMVTCMITDKKFQLINNNNRNSNRTYTVTRGLQQGTVNSPILFNIFTASLLNLFKINKVEISALAFADDLILYTADNNLRLIQIRLQQVFDEICRFYNNWKLKVNAMKCETIFIRRPPRDESAYLENIRVTLC